MSLKRRKLILIFSFLTLTYMLHVNNLIDISKLHFSNIYCMESPSTIKYLYSFETQAFLDQIFDKIARETWEEKKIPTQNELNFYKETIVQHVDIKTEIAKRTTRIGSFWEGVSAGMAVTAVVVIGGYGLVKFYLSWK